MNIIDSAAALARTLDSPIDPKLRCLLCLRRDQLLTNTGCECDLGDLVQFIVVDPHDAISAIEAAADYPVVTSPAFDWVADHGGLFEAVTILSDDGFGVVLLVPDSEGVDGQLLALLRNLAASAMPDAPDRVQEERPAAP